METNRQSVCQAIVAVGAERGAAMEQPDRAATVRPEGAATGRADRVQPDRAATVRPDRAATVRPDRVQPDRAATERPNKNVARGEATRAQLIAIATRVFAERGYEDTSIEAVLREAGGSRGSLYHHFPGKEALFEAVAEDVETSVGEQTLAAALGAGGGPVDALRAGSL